MPDETTPCIRCGQRRVVAKSWTEYIGNSLVTFTTTICPDPACQKIVEADLKGREEKLAAHQQRSRQRRQNILIARKPHGKNTASS